MQPWWRVFSKQGQLLFGPAQLGTLWQGFLEDCQDPSGDPIVLYDEIANRWLLSQFSTRGPEFFNCVAISTTGDPLGNYQRYAFSTGANFPDYPKYGVWQDGYYITYLFPRDMGSLYLSLQLGMTKRQHLTDRDPYARITAGRQLRTPQPCVRGRRRWPRRGCPRSPGRASGSRPAPWRPRCSATSCSGAW